MKVALVYDRVNKFGGAERVLTSLKKIYPDAPIYTLVYNSSSAPWSKGFQIIPTVFNHLKWLRSRHELLAPLAGLAFETFNFDKFDVVVSVTSADAKAVLTKPKTLHLSHSHQISLERGYWVPPPSCPGRHLQFFPKSLPPGRSGLCLPAGSLSGYLPRSRGKNNDLLQPDQRSHLSSARL